MTLALRPYQEITADWLTRTPRSNLWIPMGLGKTVSTLTAITRIDLFDNPFPVLVLAPLRVANSVWAQEVEKWPHLRGLRVSVVTGTAKQRLAALHVKADIYVTNYDNLLWLCDTLGDRWPYRMVVADECSRLKGFRLQQGGRRARALGRRVHVSPMYVGLTGTPAGNGLVDLWGPAWMVDRGQRLGRSFEAFKTRWFQTIQVGEDRAAVQLQPLPYAQEQIEDALRDVVLALNTADWFNVAEPIVTNITVDLPPVALAQYKQMEKELFVELASGLEVEAFAAASKVQKLLQLASGAIYTRPDCTAYEVTHDAKIDALADIIEEAGGAPVLVAYHFRSDLARLLKAFPRARHLDQKPQTIVDWNAGKIPVLLAHPASAGHGLNLQDGGNILVYYSHDWNLENRQQILERIGPVRQKQAGYNRNVFVYNLIARRTLDTTVLQRVETKRSVQDLLLERMKGNAQ